MSLVLTVCCIMDFCDECIHVLELPSDLLDVITHMPGTRTEKSNTILHVYLHRSTNHSESEPSLTLVHVSICT